MHFGSVGEMLIVKGAGVYNMQLGCAMKLLPATVITGTEVNCKEFNQFRISIGAISMSLLDTEKWLLVEWGNGARGVVHSRYMVQTTKSDLKAGCTITISKRGEQQLATYIARSNDRQLLDKIASDKAGPSVPPEPEAMDFSPSSSDWEPSDDDESDSEVETAKQTTEVVHTPASTETRSKRVIKPTYKVQAIVPNTIQKSRQMNMKTYLNCRKRPREASTYIPENNNTQPNNKNKTPSNNVTGPRLVTATFDINLITGILGAMNKLVKGLAMLKGDKSQKREININREKMIMVEETDEESTHSDECNRSDDNVLISNKYVNIESNEQEHESLIGNNQSIAFSIGLVQTDNTINLKNEHNHTVMSEIENEQGHSLTNGMFENNTEEDTEEAINKETQKVLSDTQTQNNVVTNKQAKKNIVNNAKEEILEKMPGEDDSEWIPIGSGKTLIHKNKFRNIKWTSYTVATRTLLLALFPRRTLATHSLTGKKSPAFQNKPIKMCLDPKKISDIVLEVMDRFGVKENLVRGVITTKCADESKMFRMRMNKKKKSIVQMQKVLMNDNSNKENS